MNRITCETERDGEYPQTLKTRTHSFRADVGPASGGHDEAPGTHDYFDGALASCKALTAIWYAKQKGIPLDRVDVRIDRDDSEERKGKYRLVVEVTFHGNLDDEQKKRLHAAVAHCPIQKLMTTTEIVIETTEPSAV